MKYKYRGDVKVDGVWSDSGWHEASVTINAKQEQRDNFGPLKGVEEVRNIEVQVIDWNFLP